MYGLKHTDTTETYESETLPIWKNGIWTIGDIIIQDYDKSWFIFSTIITPIQFKLRFTPQERVAIYASTDPIIKDFISILDDPRLNEVNLFLQSTIDAVQYLRYTDLLKDDIRVIQILDTKI